MATAKRTYSTSAALTINLASLATSSTLTAGRESTAVDNSTTGYDLITVYYSIKLGTSPTGNKAIYFAVIRSDNDGHYDYGATGSDAALTIDPMPNYIHVAGNKSSPATGDVIKGSFQIFDPGPKWSLFVSHDTAVALDSTGGNHVIDWVGIRGDVT